MPQELHNSILKKANVSNLICTSHINIGYLTGTEGESGMLLITKKGLELYVHDLMRESAENTANENVSIFPISNFVERMKKIKKCGFECKHVSVKEFSLWKKRYKNTKFVQADGIIEEFRRGKSIEEIKKFKKAQSITKDLLSQVPRLLKRGVTESFVAEELRRLAIDAGAEGLSFPPIVAFGTNSSRPHHLPSNRKLKKGMLVQIDVGAKYKGFCADQSRVFWTGKKTSDQAIAYKAVKEAQTEAKKAVKAGVTNHMLFKIACNVLEKYGMREEFIHSLGHGVGLEVHEGINLSDKAPKTKLKAGEIITIEPGVYFEGKFGIRLEEEVIVK
ncbi:MAG: aminopeptidase P family protein [Candidatus Peribacteraceae bacterium]|nr:aminopeptidase P family protein [Candidatus Peribacteraceae bacterium]